MLSVKHERRTSVKHERRTLRRTLDELEGTTWGDPPPKASYLVGTLNALRKKPIGEFTTEDLRICIAQNLGLQWLIPCALATLERDPLAAGDFYEGDLLLAVIRARYSISRNHELVARLQQVVHRACELLKERPDLKVVLAKLEQEWVDQGA